MSQRRTTRLNAERDWVVKYFGKNAIFHNFDGPNTEFLCPIKSNSDKNYWLRLHVPDDYPNSKPSMTIAFPENTKGYNGLDLTKVSEANHTLTAIFGEVQICHIKNWEPNQTFYQVIMKGRIWIEAYEGHCRTGNDIDYYLKKVLQN